MVTVRVCPVVWLEGDDFAGIRGLVMGEISSGVQVDLGGDAEDSTTTNASGYYEFTGLAAGSYTVIPTAEDVVFAPADASVTLAVKATRNFYGRRVWTISGAITGAETEGITVALTGDATSSMDTAIDGLYSFGVFNGSYVVTPTLAGYTFAPASISVTVSGADDSGNDFVSSAA